jgi:hypothetical protein
MSLRSEIRPALALLEHPWIRLTDYILYFLATCEERTTLSYLTTQCLIVVQAESAHVSRAVQHQLRRKGSGGTVTLSLYRIRLGLTQLHN